MTSCYCLKIPPTRPAHTLEVSTLCGGSWEPPHRQPKCWSKRNEKSTGGRGMRQPRQYNLYIRLIYALEEIFLNDIPWGTQVRKCALDMPEQRSNATQHSTFAHIFRSRHFWCMGIMVFLWLCRPSGTLTSTQKPCMHRPGMCLRPIYQSVYAMCAFPNSVWLRRRQKTAFFCICASQKYFQCSILLQYCSRCTTGNFWRAPNRVHN